MRSATFCILALVVVILSSSVQCQKFYTVSSMNTNLYLSTSCYVSVSEEVSYEFTGSYSQVGRGIPYTVASNIQSSSVSVSVLTPGYSLVSKSLVSQNDAFFIVTSFYPSTPSGTKTNIRLRLTYSVSGPVSVSGSKDVVTYSYKESVDVSSVSLNVTFDSSLGLKSSDLSPVGGSVNGLSVSFSKSNLIANTEFAPSVSFPALSAFDNCKGGGSPILTIVLIVVGVSICICLSIVCSIIGFFRRALFPWTRGGGYGFIGGSNHSYGTHHHHHNNGGGYYSGGGGRSSGLTGSSGFAN